MDPLHILPPEVLEMGRMHFKEIVLASVDVKSVVVASETCREWQHYIDNSESLWKKLCMNHCDCTNVTLDRKQGFTWKEALKRNYGPAETKKMWRNGLYSNISAIPELPAKRTYSMTASDWGDILDWELSKR